MNETDLRRLPDSAHRLDVAEFRRAAAWRQTGASPFGIGLHFLSGGPSDLRIPFRLDAVPDRQPPSYYVLLRQEAESLAADVFVMPAEGAVTSWLGRFRRQEPERFAHPAGMRRITRVVVHGGQPQALEAAGLDLRLIRFEASPGPLLEVEFDRGTGGRTWDLRPVLPRSCLGRGLTLGEVGWQIACCRVRERHPCRTAARSSSTSEPAPTATSRAPMATSTG